MKRALSAMLVAWALAASAPARAADPPAPPTPSAVQDARAHFNRGVDAFKDGDYHAALAEFNRAYALTPNYKVFYNIGQTCAELQDYPCALDSMRQYLDGGKDQIPAARRSAVQADIERFRGLVGTLTVHVSVAGADVLIDDQPVGTSPLPAPVMVSAGRRKIAVVYRGLAPVTRVAEIAGGDAAVVDVPIAEPLPAAATPPAPVAPPPSVTPAVSPPVPVAGPTPVLPSQAPPDAARSSDAPFWIGVVTTVALTSAGAITGSLTVNKRSALDAELGRYPLDASRADDLRGQVRTFGAVTDVLFAGAIVAAGVSTVLYVVHARAPSRVGAAPGGVSVAF